MYFSKSDSSYKNLTVVKALYSLQYENFGFYFQNPLNFQRSDRYVICYPSRRPTGINIFVKNTHQSEQLPPKEEVLLGNWVVKAKWLAVSFTSNISLKKIIWAFWRFYMYLRFKINIFKMQLLKNDTANLIDFNCFWSHFVSSFRKSCPLWCVILIKIHFQKIIGLVGHRKRPLGKRTTKV